MSCPSFSMFCWGHEPGWALALPEEVSLTRLKTCKLHAESRCSRCDIPFKEQVQLKEYIMKGSGRTSRFC